MHTSDQYLRLKRDFAELQLRVTQFSSVEQQLIIARDSLDQELVQYKRLNKLSAAILQATSELEFINLVTDGIIDILELESSIVFVGDSEDLNSGYFSSEGLGHYKGNQQHLISVLFNVLSTGNNIHLNKEDIQKHKELHVFSDVLGFLFKDDTKNSVLLAVGFVGVSNAKLYRNIDNRTKSIFSVFSDKIKLQFLNRNKNTKIKEQLERISQSEIELKKLSMIATNTKNGVIIANKFGEIEWVNNSFSKTSGYEMHEVLGKKPGNFLQGLETSPDAKSAISEALSKKLPIEIVLLNYDKRGREYYVQLEVIPVFNDHGEHVNFIALQKDMTDEIKYQQEILRMNSKFELVTDSSKIGIWEWDLINKSGVCNSNLRQQFGISEEVSSDLIFSIFKNSILPEDKEWVMKGIYEVIHGTALNVVQTFRIENNLTGKQSTLHCFTLAEKDTKGNLLRLIGSTFDITDSINAQQDILEKNEELKKINSELDNFVYSVSHDLRSPLVSIKGILMNVLRMGTLDEKATRFLQLAEVSANRLDDTIQEIMEYSKNARLGLTLEEVNLKALCQTIFDDLRFSVEDYFEFHYKSTISDLIFTDKYRITALLKNIIGNAVKYHRKDILNPYVELSVKHDHEALVLTVTDNGIGISEKSISRIFEMFYRATTSSVGTGLGLYICKEIVTKLNGEISAESQEGIGTTMLVRMPKLNAKDYENEIN
ncbi:MAG: ATP-binding protein [Bacteroidia bacterium]